MKLPRVTQLINKYVATEFPGYRQKGRIFYKEPLTNILRGYYFGQSRAPTILRMWVFVQPLYVPDDDVSVTLGGEITSQEPTESKEEFAMASVMRAMKLYEPHVERLHNPAGLVRDEWVAPSRSVYENQISAYSQVMAGDYLGGLSNLESLRDHIRKLDSKGITWSNLPEHGCTRGDVAGRASSRPTACVAMLNAWTEQTKANLKLA